MNKYIDAELLRKKVQEQINYAKGVYPKGSMEAERATAIIAVCLDILASIDSLQQEQPKIGLEEFTQKMDDWKARYNHPDNIPIKATMAFTARMFYMYPDIAREWYAGLPKATQD